MIERVGVSVIVGVRETVGVGVRVRDAVAVTVGVGLAVLVLEGVIDTVRVTVGV